MRKQTFGRIKKTIAVLLLVVFISALAATSVSAQIAAEAKATKYAVTFDASKSVDDNGDPQPPSPTAANAKLRFDWDFGDGSTFGTFFPVITHVFSDMDMRSHRVKLTVTDINSGNTNTIRVDGKW